MTTTERLVMKTTTVYSSSSPASLAGYPLVRRIVILTGLTFRALRAVYSPRVVSFTIDKTAHRQKNTDK